MSTDQATAPQLPAVRLSSLKADLQKEAEGEWIEVPDVPGLTLAVRSLELPAFKLARDSLIQRLARKYQRKPVPQEVISREYGKLYAVHILFGWKGLDTEYSPQAAMEVLTDPAYRKLLGYIESAAAQVADTDIEYVEEAEKN